MDVMTEYKKTALVLGAGGFIGSHMVKRLRSEGYWVRGVDLKRPEYSETEANEFIQGDLRDVDFVAKVIQYKGEQGNFYNHIPYRLIRPFDEIYQFAADMGGAGFVFTGENDADIMHNSVTINLNVLEEVRKLNETFDGVSGNGLRQIVLNFHNQQRSSILDRHVCIQNTTNLTLITLIVVKNQHTQQTQTPSTDGRNSSLNVSTLLTVGTMVSLFVLLGITIFLDLKEPGTEEERKHQLQSAVRSLTSRTWVEASKCGEMAYKLVPSCTLMNALKQLDD